jgi:predicted aspartyl protease
VATDGLVDTGATTTFIPKEIADLLDLIPSGDNVVHLEASGAGGRFPTTPVTLKRLTLVKNISPFAEFVEVPAMIPDQDDVLPYVILGRDRVFKRFNITFQERRRKFVFDRT